MPLSPVPSPSMSRPLRMTVSVAPAWMTMALVPDTSTPASKPSELIVIDLVMVTAPKPPGSSTLISPAGAVFEIAPAKVLHGAVRLHGLASSPTPETQVRVACACAGAENSEKHIAKTNGSRTEILEILMTLPLVISTSTRTDSTSRDSTPTHGYHTLTIVALSLNGRCGEFVAPLRR